jgi:3-methylcrotonyl-CoA carboxylase alpha subunit
MRALGDKISAKTLAVSAGVPIVPGFFDPGASFDQICDAAARIGYPVMLKASAGGGGRGMREVASADRLESEFVTASAEARSVFGDGAMMVEKLIARPRHVEVQVLADHHGNVATLFERECSIQRRHQKLIEEAPSPFEILRWKAMRAAAANVVRAAGYSNAGTVEFIVDPVSGEFYFLEVNARLQVEHPVTEAITGLDLVAWQIRIAEGEPLDLPEALLNGERPGICGHAIEVRIIAEDPSRQFVPSIGKILAWAEPMSSVVRVDTGFGPGSEITPYYDSLLAKLIVHGQNRAEALRRMEAALMDFHILGVRTNVEYLLAVIRHPEFAAGKIDTGFLGREFHEWMPGAPAPEVGSIASRAGNTARRSGEASRGPLPASSLADGFRNVGS